MPNENRETAPVILTIGVFRNSKNDRTKCVFPRPTPPYISSGLNAVPPGLLATA